MRDGKLKRSSGCAAGGECGLPEAGEGKYPPILNWTTCHVIDWLNGLVRTDVRKTMADVFALTKKLVAVYDVKVSQEGFDWNDPEVSAARFGCIGCPAIGAERAAPRSVIARHGIDSAIAEIYDVWFEAREAKNRCVNLKHGHVKMPGPIRLEVRKRLFVRVMDIQRRSGITLITPEDEAFIRGCWERKVYPRGWSEADEMNEAPEEPLFTGT